MIRKSTYILLIILLVLSAIVIFIQRTPGLKSGLVNQATSTQAPRLFDWGDKIVQTISLSDREGHVFKANLDNQSKWIIEMPSDCQLDENRISNYISQLHAVAITLELETPPALADIGLVNPAYRLSITFNDGSIQELAVGSVVPTGSGYYVQVDREPVVVVAKYSIDSFFELVGTACATPTSEMTSDVAISTMTSSP